MRKLLVAIVLAMALIGCSKADPAKIQEVTVSQVEQMLAKDSCQPVDANGEGTRKKLGVIPGAVLLSDSEMFAPSELPADKTRPLVFYCTNQHCGASHEAAEKARIAGYKNVKIMPDGIAGWVKAGKPVTKVGGEG